MSIKSKEDIISIVNQDWSESSGNQSIVLKICLNIIEYLKKIDFSKVSYITYGDLRQQLKDNEENHLLLQAIQYLSGDRIHLLDIKFELITEDDESIEVSKQELSHARAVGTLIHPDTGEAIGNFEEKVFIYFQPSLIAKQYLK